MRDRATAGDLLVLLVDLPGGISLVCEVRLFEDVDRQYETVSGVLVEVDDRDIGVADILVVGVGEINCEGRRRPSRRPFRSAG